VIVDSHNEGIYPYSSKNNWLMPIYNFIQKFANLTIVTNDNLAKIVNSNGGRPIVLKDKIPDLKPTAIEKLRSQYNIAFVCSFEKDEPFKEVIASAKLLEESVSLYITGNYDKISSEIVKNAPSNVIFCGFLSEQNYVNLLSSCDIVMDLTLMTDCLVCGAYESVALEKPIILSDFYTLRRNFYKGTTFTQNTTMAIAQAIKKSIDNLDVLKKDIIDLKKELNLGWESDLKNLIKKVSDLK
jgi:hypothetical protein